MVMREMPNEEAKHLLTDSGRLVGAARGPRSGCEVLC